MLFTQAQLRVSILIWSEQVLNVTGDRVIVNRWNEFVQWYNSVLSGSQHNYIKILDAKIRGLTYENSRPFLDMGA